MNSNDFIYELFASEREKAIQHWYLLIDTPVKCVLEALLQISIFNFWNIQVSRRS